MGDASPRMAPSMSSPDAVERPALGWWLAIPGGLAALAVVAFDRAAYAWWAAHVTAAFSQPLLLAVWIASLAVHVGEALYARRLALRHGLIASATGWFWQTVALGFPSLRLLRQRTEG